MKRLLQLMLVVLTLVALASQVVAQQKESSTPAPNPLLRLLQSKGIITEQEAATVAEAASPAESQAKLAKLLLSKGVINQDEYDQTLASIAAEAASANSPRVVNAAAHIPDATGAAGPLATPAASSTTASAASGTPAANTTTATAQAQSGPSYVPAANPIRVLPITIPKREGLIPDLRLGSGAVLRPYGFIKLSAVHDTASSGGPNFGSNDFLLPLLLADTGPTKDSQFHIKSRSSRLGVDFEWPDLSKNLTLTGKVEVDFEGDFTQVNNRNISSIRSSQLGIRLAWARLDTKLADTPFFVQFGQDWTILGSTTLPDLFEGTGLGLAMGTFYERTPQIRTGLQFGKGDFKFEPEFALVFPGFGEGGLSADQRERFGSRVGPESGQPGVQARLVFQFPLTHAAGVAPAQIVFSGGHAQRAEIVDAADLPAIAAVKAAFPTGARVTSDQNIWTAEISLPTAYLTLTSKYFRGGDMRYYFSGIFNDIFTDTSGRPVLGNGTAFSGRAIPFFQDTSGIVHAGTLQPIRGQGGFVQLGIPLSRIFGADPAGRAAGWSMYLHWGMDSAYARDVIRTGGNGLYKTDYGTASLRYKINKYVQFVHEVSYTDSRAVSGKPKLFDGTPAHTAHSWRNEFGTIFAF